MIILRNSLFSKKKVTLEEIPKGSAGRKMNPLKNIGRQAGYEEANKLDSEGKSDIEIIEGASKKAKKIGRIAGGTAGLVLGIPAGIEAKRFLDDISDQTRLVSNTINPVKGGAARTGKLARIGSNMPVIGRRYLSKKKAGKQYTTGKWLSRYADAAKGVEKKLDKVVKRSGRISKIAKKSALPASVGVVGLSTLGGAYLTGKASSQASERNTIDRLGKRHRLEKQKK